MADLHAYRITWSEDDQEYVGTCEQMPSVSHLAPTQAEALAGIIALVADIYRLPPQEGSIADRLRKDPTHAP